MNILGPEVSFVDLVDHGILEKQKKDREEFLKGKKSYFPLRPSSAGHCSRKLALELEEYLGIRYHNKPELKPNIVRLFELGHSVERAVIDTLIKNSGFDIRYRQQVVDMFRLETGELIEGSIDLVLMKGPYKCVADVKSKKMNWSAGFKSSWDELLDDFSSFESLCKISDTGYYADDLQFLIDELDNDYMIDNLYQLNLYANTKFCKDRDINFCSLIYYAKNTSEMFELRFRPSEEIFKQTERKYNEVAKIVKEGKVDEMECEFPIGTMRHSFCDCHKMRPYLPDDPSTYYFGTLPPKKWPTDSNRLKKFQDIEKSYNAFKSLQKEAVQLEKEEQKIIQILLDEKKQKVRFADGAIYEAKFLKTKNKFELRRAKL